MPIPLSIFPGSKNTWTKQMDTFYPLNPLCEVYRIPKDSRKAHQQRATIVTANQECTKLGKGESFPDRECVPSLPPSANLHPSFLDLPWVPHLYQAFPAHTDSSPTEPPQLHCCHHLLRAGFSRPQGLRISSPSSCLSVPQGLFQNELHIATSHILVKLNQMTNP